MIANTLTFAPWVLLGIVLLGIYRWVTRDALALVSAGGGCTPQEHDEPQRRSSLFREQAELERRLPPEGHNRAADGFAQLPNLRPKRSEPVRRSAPSVRAYFDGPQRVQLRSQENPQVYYTPDHILAEAQGLSLDLSLDADPSGVDGGGSWDEPTPSAGIGGGGSWDDIPYAQEPTSSSWDSSASDSSYGSSSDSSSSSWDSGSSDGGSGGGGDW